MIVAVGSVELKIRLSTSLDTHCMSSKATNWVTAIRNDCFVIDIF